MTRRSVSLRGAASFIVLNCQLVESDHVTVNIGQHMGSTRTCSVVSGRISPVYHHHVRNISTCGSVSTFHFHFRWRHNNWLCWRFDWLTNRTKTQNTITYFLGHTTPVCFNSEVTAIWRIRTKIAGANIPQQKSKIFNETPHNLVYSLTV